MLIVAGKAQIAAGKRLPGVRRSSQIGPTNEHRLP